MIAAFVCLALFAQDSNLSKVITKPTGQNGYEEYVQAALVLNRAENRPVTNYVRWASSNRSGTAIARPGAIPDGLTTLDLYRIEVKQMHAAIDLVRAGNLKPVRYPNPPITPVTLFPEYVSFKLVARLIQHAAYVAFADGNPKEGVNLILDGLTFAEKMQVGDIISLLVSRSCAQFMYQAVDAHSGQIPLSGAERLLQWSQGITPRFVAAAIRTSEISRAQNRFLFDEFFNKPAEFFEGTDFKQEQKDKMYAALRAVPAARRDKIYGMFFKRLEAPWNGVIARLKGPEYDWLTPIDEEDFIESDDIERGVGDDVAGSMMVLLQMYGMLGSINDDLPLTFAGCTVQDRIFAAHAACIVYRWKFGKYPPNLAALSGKEPIDPATGEPYTYQLRDGGGFNILCKHPALGEITLSARRSPKPGDDDVPPPLTGSRVNP